MIIIVGESGSGKTSVLNELIKRNPILHRVVTYTTRPQRAGEVDGIDYHFVSVDKFEELRDNGELLEHTNYNGWMYGTPKSVDGNSVLVMTPSGMRAAKRAKICAKCFYIKVDRRSRMIKLLERGDEINEVVRRSMSDVGQFDGVEDEVDHCIYNEKYEHGIREIEDMIWSLYMQDINMEKDYDCY